MSAVGMYGGLHTTASYVPVSFSRNSAAALRTHRYRSSTPLSAAFSREIDGVFVQIDGRANEVRQAADERNPDHACAATEVEERGSFAAVPGAAPTRALAEKRLDFLDEHLRVGTRDENPFPHVKRKRHELG